MVTQARAAVSVSAERWKDEYEIVSSAPLVSSAAATERTSYRTARRFESSALTCLSRARRSGGGGGGVSEVKPLKTLKHDLSRVDCDKSNTSSASSSSSSSSTTSKSFSIRSHRCQCVCACVCQCSQISEVLTDERDSETELGQPFMVVMAKSCAVCSDKFP